MVYSLYIVSVSFIDRISATYLSKNCLVVAPRTTLLVMRCCIYTPHRECVLDVVGAVCVTTRLTEECEWRGGHLVLTSQMQV